MRACQELPTPAKKPGFWPNLSAAMQYLCKKPGFWALATRNPAVRNPAVRNRVYTNDVRLRGRRGYSEIQNHGVKSSTRGGGFCLCSRGFNRRVFGFLVFLWVGDRVFGLMCDRVLLFNYPAVGNPAVRNPAVGNRVYTNDVRLRGLRNREFERNVRSTLQPAEARECLCRRGFNRRVRSTRYDEIFNPQRRVSVCVDAVSTAGFQPPEI